MEKRNLILLGISIFIFLLGSSILILIFLPESELNYSDCINLTYTHQKDECIFDIASVKNDINGCDMIVGNSSKYLCLIHFAVQNNATNQCNAILSDDYFGTCIIKVVKKLNNSKYCDALKLGGERNTNDLDKCINQFNEEQTSPDDLSDSEGCNGEDCEVDENDKYFMSLALTDLDIEKCRLIRDSFGKDSCYGGVLNELIKTCRNQGSNYKVCKNKIEEIKGMGKFCEEVNSSVFKRSCEINLEKLISPLIELNLSRKCGDEIIDPWEECDSGNLFDGSFCSKNCTFIKFRSLPVKCQMMSGEKMGEDTLCRVSFGNLWGSCMLKKYQTSCITDLSLPQNANENHYKNHLDGILNGYVKQVTAYNGRNYFVNFKKNKFSEPEKEDLDCPSKNKKTVVCQIPDVTKVDKICYVSFLEKRDQCTIKEGDKFCKTNLEIPMCNNYRQHLYVKAQVDGYDKHYGNIGEYYFLKFL